MSGSAPDAGPAAVDRTVLRGVVASGKAIRHRFGYRAQEFLRRLWSKSVEDDVLFMAGAVAFNLLIAIVPLLVLGIGLAGYVASARLGDPADAVLALLADYFPAGGGGLDVSAAVRGFVEELLAQRGGLTLLGAIFFVLLATRLVGSVRTVLREIFDVATARGILAGKLFDVQVVVVGVFLLTLNLGVTVVLGAALDLGVGIVGLESGLISVADRLAGIAIAFGSIWVLFLIVYRYLPARRIPWRTSMVAATFSAVLHEALKYGFGWYATEVANYTSALGNLATVAVLLFWIYYEAVVFILGGEVAQVYTMRKASRIQVRRTFEADG